MNRKVSTLRLRFVVSRGPGVWQRRILDRLAATRTPFYLTELLPDGMTPRHGGYQAAYQALWRACMTLLDQGRVMVVIYREGTPSRLLIVPDGDRPRHALQTDAES